MSTDNEQLLSGSQKSSASSDEISKQSENNKKNEPETSTLTGLPINQTDQILDALDQDLQTTNNQNNQDVPLAYFGANIEGSNNINVSIDLPTIIHLHDMSLQEQNDYKLYCILKKNAFYIKFLAVLDFLSSLIWIFGRNTEFILGLIFPPVGYYGALRFRKLYVALYSFYFFCFETYITITRITDWKDQNTFQKIFLIITIPCILYITWFLIRFYRLISKNGAELETKFRKVKIVDQSN
ncbi:hypothetical protein M0813_12242 [Anaeramoeba flamelloides]|uniref:Transmembrane protein n=1 Tax=Anaeramoeba flamelloides TaxID=1746091 RepID=A0ABQ8ZCP2_9EUKA|nr:hypothetical protein M0813_12242 [Anaeramoeba flamelloides]